MTKVIMKYNLTGKLSQKDLVNFSFCKYFYTSCKISFRIIIDKLEKYIRSNRLFKNFIVVMTNE